jgi:hypothetical protein
MGDLKYSIIQTLIIYILNNIINFFININYNIDFLWITKFCGSVIALLIYHFHLVKIFSNYNFYYLKCIKYYLILFFQTLSFNIFSKNNFSLSLHDFNRVSFYVLIYILCDKIGYNYYNDKDKKEYEKEENNDVNMKIDIFRFICGYLIVESAFCKKITQKDIIFLLIFIVAIFIYYKIINDKLKQLLK